MSEFVVVFDHKGFSQSEGNIEEMLARIDVFGVNGSQIVKRPNIQFGVQHFWTTQEDFHKQQPAYCYESDLWLVLSGRIDNREEIYRLLNTHKKPLTELSDPELALALIKESWNQQLHRIIGPFVLVAFDEKNSKLLAARDGIGGRNLITFRSGSRTYLSTQEQSYLGCADYLPQLNPSRLVDNLCLYQTLGQETYLADLEQLKPGHNMQVTPDGYAIQKFWEPDVRLEINSSNPGEYTERFRTLLKEAVDCRLRTQSNPGLMLSGGLDSTPIAALAAECGRQLKTYSWIFDQYPESDERQFFMPLIEKLGFDWQGINCDQAWPFYDEGNIPSHPVAPFDNPFRTFHEFLYDQAQQNGTSVLLTGLLGDHLYLGTENLVLELLKRGKLSAAWSESRHRINPEWTLLRRFKNLILSQLSIYPTIRSALGTQYPHWITNLGKELHTPAEFWSENWQHARRPAQYKLVMSMQNGQGFNYETWFSTRYQIQLRHPFRHRPLIEFVLNLPSEELNYQGVSRPILRRAMEPCLPQELVQRAGKANFHEVFRKGIATERHDVAMQLFNMGHSGLKELLDFHVGGMENFTFTPSKSTIYNTNLSLFWLVSSFGAWENATDSPRIPLKGI